MEWYFRLCVCYHVYVCVYPCVFTVCGCRFTRLHTHMYTHIQNKYTQRWMSSYCSVFWRICGCMCSTRCGSSNKEGWRGVWVEGGTLDRGNHLLIMTIKSHPKWKRAWSSTFSLQGQNTNFGWLSSLCNSMYSVPITTLLVIFWVLVITLPILQLISSHI